MSDVMDRYKAELMNQISRSVDGLLSSRTITNFSADALDATASSAVAGVLEANRINDQLGAFYSTERVMKVLGGVSRQAVNDRVKKHRLLRVRTSDGVLLFPAFQFSETGEMRPGVADILQILLSSGEDPWTVAYWMTSPIEDFDSQTALEVLSSRMTDEIDDLLELARDDAMNWHNVSHGEIEEHIGAAE